MSVNLEKIVYLSVGVGLIFAVMWLLVWGTNLPEFALWKVFVMILPAAVLIILLMQSHESLRFLFFSFIVALPVLGIALPPKRWGITALDLLVGLMVIFLLFRNNVTNTKIKLVPEPLVLAALLLVFPSVVLAIDPMTSIIEYIRMIGFYLAFVVVHHFLSEPDVRDKVVFWLATSVIIVGLFVFIEKQTGINFSNSGQNVNALTYVGTSIIYRTAGLFQDPQKVGQFLAVLLVLLVVLWSRGIPSLRRTRWWVLIAIALGAGALLLTVSRMAIAGGFSMAIVSYITLGKSSILKKIAFIGIPALTVVLLILAFSSIALVEKFVPENLQKRFTTVDRSQDGRFGIWEDSWHIFEENPLTGIGPGNYQEYLMRENPKFRRYEKVGGYVPSQPESGYLKILYETGTPGAIGMIVLFFAFLMRIIKTVISCKDDNERSWSLAVGASLIVYLATFSTLFTPSDPRNAVLVLLMIALVGSFRNRSIAERQERLSENRELTTVSIPGQPPGRAN